MRRRRRRSRGSQLPRVLQQIQPSVVGSGVLPPHFVAAAAAQMVMVVVVVVMVMHIVVVSMDVARRGRGHAAAVFSSRPRHVESHQHGPPSTPGLLLPLLAMLAHPSVYRDTRVDCTQFCCGAEYICVPLSRSEKFFVQTDDLACGVILLRRTQRPCVCNTGGCIDLATIPFVLEPGFHWSRAKLLLL